MNGDTTTLLIRALNRSLRVLQMKMLDAPSIVYARSEKLLEEARQELKGLSISQDEFDKLVTEVILVKLDIDIQQYFKPCGHCKNECSKENDLGFVCGLNPPDFELRDYVAAGFVWQQEKFCLSFCSSTPGVRVSAERSIRLMEAAAKQWRESVSQEGLIRISDKG